MATSPKSPFRTSPAATPPVVLVNARIPSDTVTAAKKLADAADETMTDFVRIALENEVSRRTLCPTPRPVSLADLDKKLSQILDLAAAAGAQTRLQTEATLAMHQAMGIETPA